MGLIYENKAEIWDDETGSHIEVGPDRDGLELVEIRRHNEEGKIGERIVMSRDEAALVIRALRETLKAVGHIPSKPA